MDKILKKLDYYNLWNKAYLIILGLYVLINVLDTTMFEINWPEKMGYVLYAIVGGYAIAKMICFVYLKRYRAWELIFSFIIIGTFTIPAVFTIQVRGQFQRLCGCPHLAVDLRLGHSAGIADGVEHHVQRIAADIAQGADTGGLLFNKGTVGNAAAAPAAAHGLYWH